VKRFLLIALILCEMSMLGHGQIGAIQGFATQGGVKAVTQGAQSTNNLQGIIPSATITVYLTGTTQLATIYANGSSAPLANPFIANAAGSSNPGAWIFWAATNQGVDVIGSGGIAPNTYPTPVPLCVACYPSTAVSIAVGVASWNGRTGIVTMGAADVDNVGTISNNTTGNAATATALAATPTQCTSPQFSQGIAANGNSNCATPSATAGVNEIIPGTNVTCATNVGGSCAGNVTVNASAGNAITALTGDVTATGPGSAAASVVGLSHVTNGSLANSGLAHSSTTVNGQTCTLGSSCTVSDSGAGVIPSVVQSNYVYDCNPEAPDCTQITLTNPVVPGDAIIVDTYHIDSGGPGPVTVSDNQGDTFTAANYNAGAYNAQQEVVCGAVGGPTTITYTGASYNIIAVYEVANVATSSCIDNGTSGYNSAFESSYSTPLSTGLITTLTPYDFVLVTGASRTSSNSNPSEANSYTPIIATPLIDGALNYSTWYGTPSSTGSLSDSITLNSPTGVNNVYASILALKASTAGEVLTANGSGLPATYQPPTVGPSICSDTTGSATAQSCATNPSFTPVAGKCIAYNTTTSNTGALTLNVNSSSAAAVQKWLGTALASGDMPANKTNTLCYDGAHWQVMTIGNAPSGSGSATAAPPYIEISTTFYMANDMYAVTKPPSSPSWINSVAPGTITTGTNGDLILQTAGTGTTYFQTESGTASVEAEINAINQAGNGQDGIWMYDSTNSVIWALMAFYNSGNVQLCAVEYTYNGSGNPSFDTDSCNNGGIFAWGPWAHLRLVKSGSNLLFEISLDGGGYYRTLYTEAVGTLAQGGVVLSDNSQAMTLDVASLAVN
jgi:hypothetical protein